MSTVENKPTSLIRFENARAEHSAQMTEFISVVANITRCEKERQAAIEAGKEAESNWRTNFRKLRGNLTEELRAEHTHRIANRELADEFAGLLKELELDKQYAVLCCCTSGKKYVEAHKTAFTEFADLHWESALRNVSPSLLWTIKLRIQREKIASTFAGDNHDPIRDIAKLVG